MLTAGALCRDQVKRVVETAASQRLVVMAILDKPKVRASSISRKDTEMKPAQSIVLRAAKEQLFFCSGRGFFVRWCWIGDCLRKRSTRLLFPEERRIIENYYRSGSFERVAARLSETRRKASSWSSETSIRTEHSLRDCRSVYNLYRRIWTDDFPAYRTTGRESFSKEMLFSLTGAAIEFSISSKT